MTAWYLWKGRNTRTFLNITQQKALELKIAFASGGGEEGPVKLFVNGLLPQQVGLN